MRQFGTTHDEPDDRDRVYLPATTMRPPRRVDLRPHCPPVYNQHSLNSCSANAIAAAMWFDERQDGSTEACSPSRLFIYYNERRHERDIHRNIAVSIRDGYEAVAAHGVCAERLWPYRVRHFARKPTPHCYRVAKSARVRQHFRIHRDPKSLKTCLAEGSPFTMGVSVHKSFKSARVKRTGLVPMPTRRDPYLGGHAVLVVGYDDEQQHFIVRNSWGRTWGLKGYCLVPYTFVLDPTFAWDFWTCRRVGQEARKPAAAGSRARQL